MEKSSSPIAPYVLSRWKDGWVNDKLTLYMQLLSGSTSHTVFPVLEEGSEMITGKLKWAEMLLDPMQMHFAFCILQS